MAELDNERDSLKKDKRTVVESTDHEGSSHVSDAAVAAGTNGEDSLVAEVSPDVAPAVEEFMEQAAQQNGIRGNSQLRQIALHISPQISFPPFAKGAAQGIGEASLQPHLLPVSRSITRGRFRCCEGIKFEDSNPAGQRFGDLADHRGLR